MSYLPLTNNYAGGCCITLNSFVGPTGPQGATGAQGATGPYNFNTYSTNYIANRVITTPNPPLQSICCDTADFRTCSLLFPALLSLQSIDFWIQSDISNWRTGDKISIQKAYDASNVVNYTLTATPFYSFSFQVPVIVDNFTGLINDGDEVIFTYIPIARDGATGPTGAPGATGIQGPTGPIGATGLNPFLISNGWLGINTSLITDGQVFMDTNNSTTTTQITISSIDFNGDDYTTFFTQLMVLPSRLFKMVETTSSALWSITNINQVGPTKFVMDVSLLQSSSIITNISTIKTIDLSYGGERGSTGPTGPIGPPGQVLGASVYGELKTSTTITTKTFTVLGAYEGFYSMVAGIANGVQLNINAPPVGSSFTILEAGIYNAQIDITVKKTVGGGNPVFDIKTFVNGVSTGTGQSFTLQTDTVPITYTFLGNGLVGQVVDLRIAQISGALATISILRNNQVVILTSPVQGPAGPTGPIGPSGNDSRLTSGVNYGDGLVWRPALNRYVPTTSDILMGTNAGLNNVNVNLENIALGTSAGSLTTGFGDNNIFMGQNAGASCAGASENIALGKSRLGGNTPGNNCAGTVRIGSLGSGLAEKGTGNFAIAIGRNTGRTNQSANSIIISALGTDLDNTTASSLKIAPIRQATSTDALFYNNTTKEITFSPASVGSGLLNTVSTTSAGPLGGAVWILPATVADITKNTSGLTTTNITLGGTNGFYMSGFTVGITYYYAVHCAFQITATASNRVVRLSQHYTNGALPAVGDIIQQANITTCFLQTSTFGNVSWGNNLIGTFTSTSATDKIWFGATSDIQTVGFGGYLQSPLTIFIKAV